MIGNESLKVRMNINRLTEVLKGKVGIHQWNVPLTYLASNNFLVVSSVVILSGESIIDIHL